MRIQWWNRIRDWVILFALLATSLTTMLVQNDSVVRYLGVLSIDVISNIEARMTWAGQYMHAIEENTVLRHENVILNNQLAQLNLASMENAELTDALAFRKEAPYGMVAARIVSKNIFGLDNYLTLNAGAADGIEKDMAVVSHQGILGRVVLVGQHYCRVLSYLNTGFRVPVEVLPSFAVGMLGWPGGKIDQLRLTDLVKTVPVSDGDTVVTSANSRIFPPGYPVGIITAVDALPGMNDLSATVRPMAPIDRTRYAFVLLHRYADERRRLEEQQPAQ